MLDTVDIPFPAFSYTREEDEVFVLGGSPFVLNVYDAHIDGLEVADSPANAHLTKFNPSTGETTPVAPDKGNTIPYIGGALVHANGYVYVISQAHLYQIDPETMTVKNDVELHKTAEPFAQNTVYNGLSTSSTGELITKFFTLSNGKDGAPDYSEFLLIDPDTLKITFSLPYAGASPRLAVEKSDDGKEYLYHLNRQNTYRFLIEKSKLTLDENWQARFDPYNTGKAENDEPTSPVIVNGRVHYTTNTKFDSPNAMKIFWQGVEDEYQKDGPPLTGPFLFETAKENGWSFFHLSIDPASNIIIGNDQGNALLTAVRVNDATGELERLWEKPVRTSTRPAIVSDRKMVYATDFKDGHNDLIVLDLETGEELIRKQTPANRASIATIIVGTNNEVYFGSNEPGETGLFHRFYVKEK